MKIMKQIIFILFIAAIGRNVCAQQVEPLKQNIDFHIDSLGNAHVAMTMKLNAAQWNNFKQAIGNNVAILKRSVERSLPAYFLDNFKYTEDAMNQSYTLKFDALGACKIDQQGRWIAEMDSKSPDVTKITDHLFLVNSTTNSDGTLIDQSIKVSFPASSGDIKVKKDAFGKAYFSFVQPTPEHGSMFWLFAGCVFMLAGLGLGYVKMKKA